MRERTLAVIDLGTYSALLLIAPCRPQGAPEILEQQFRITRLGQGLETNGRIDENTLHHTITVLREYGKLAERWKVSEIFVIGSQVFRTAANSRQARRVIEEESGYSVHELSTQEEARYAYLGAVGTGQGETLVIDVGGGSTELILGRGAEITRSFSVPIGALQLAQKMKGQVTLCSSDRLGLMQYIKLQLREVPFFNEIGAQEETIGTGGTISTLAAMKLKMETYDWKRLNNVSLSRSDIWNLFFEINKLDLARRRQLPGMEAGREDVVLYGALIFLTLMELRQIEWIRVSDRGLRYGYLLFQCNKP